jgi:putative transposase
MELYHVLNRGVDKRKIFLAKRDYFRFIHDLFEFNDTANVTNLGYFSAKYIDVGRRYIEKKRTLLVHLHAFCLMPNHYHLLVSPMVENGLSLFMKKLNGGYARYFNERHKRVGALFQGKYKSIPITGDPHFSYILYYIHLNPLDLSTHNWRQQNIQSPKRALAFLNSYRWSSHLDYMDRKNFPSVTQREFMLDFLNSTTEYKKSLNSILKDFSVKDLGKYTLE